MPIPTQQFDGFLTLRKNLKIKWHEDNVKFLETEIERLNESILNLQVSLANHHSGNPNGVTDENDATRAKEEEETEQIMRHESSAAALLCKLKSMKSLHATQALNLTLTKDVLGIVGVVASLGRVDDDNVSRILSEYLGLETMLAVVCRTYECVKVLEKYDEDGKINSSSGIHGLGSSVKNSIKGRFQVICLEDLRPYVGGFVADNPQRKLALPKPQLPNGECPHGFLDYAVNMINLDIRNLHSVTTGGHGLRETLFYSLFSRLQVYKTRREMLFALPCINDGALSLDGGMIRADGVFALGSRKKMDIKFLATSGESGMPANYAETEAMLQKLRLERTHITEDMQRERELLDLAKDELSSTL